MQGKLLRAATAEKEIACCLKFPMESHECPVFGKFHPLEEPSNRGEEKLFLVKTFLTPKLLGALKLREPSKMLQLNSAVLSLINVQLHS